MNEKDNLGSHANVGLSLLGHFTRWTINTLVEINGNYRGDLPDDVAHLLRDVIDALSKLQATVNLY